MVLFDRYVPWFRRIPLNQGITWEPTWKTVPTMRQFRDYLKAGLYSENSKTKVPDVKSFFPCLTFELSAYTFLIHFMKKWVSSGLLVSSGVTVFDILVINRISGWDLDFFSKFLGPKLPNLWIAGPENGGIPQHQHLRLLRCPTSFTLLAVLSTKRV